MIEEMYIDALLSAAAYAEWDNDDVSVIKAKLLSMGFTEAQYYALFDPQNQNRIYDIYQGSSVGYIDTSNGFSATIFENRQDHKLTVAFRGTEPGFADFVLADFLLALGIGSIAELFGVGQLSKIETFFINAGLADAAGNVLVDANSIDFVGHSLGGHLATMAAYKYPGMVDSVDTYNGAGLKGWDEIWNTYIAGSVSGGTLDKNRVTNYYADKGIEVTSDQDLWFNRPGGHQGEFRGHNT